MNSESKSRVVYENLDTTFVNLWALLRNLSQREFIGRVRVELKDYTADVFMTGSSTPLVHEIDHAAGTNTIEEAALHRLVLRVRGTPGTITVFEGADEAVAGQSDAPADTETDSSDSNQKSHPCIMRRIFVPRLKPRHCGVPRNRASSRTRIRSVRPLIQPRLVSPRPPNP